jgi:UDP:flavonoid glycosyltransferase YjiC (YdhE family)
MGLASARFCSVIPTITKRESNAHPVMALGHRVLKKRSYRRSARRVAESMRQFGGAREAAERIERLVGCKS